jgi:hypothetical protein
MLSTENRFVPQRNANYYAKANHIDLMIGHKADGVRHISFCFKHQCDVFESVFLQNPQSNTPT